MNYLFKIYEELTFGGHISYVELDGDPSKNLEAFEQIIRCMKENNMGYGSINHPVDRDSMRGWTIEEYVGNYNFCPSCGAPMIDEAVQMVMERMEVLYEQKV